MNLTDRPVTRLAGSGPSGPRKSTRKARARLGPQVMRGVSPLGTGRNALRMRSTSVLAVWSVTSVLLSCGPSVSSRQDQSLSTPVDHSAQPSSVTPGAPQIVISNDVTDGSVTPPVLRHRVTPDWGGIDIRANGKVLLDVDISDKGIVTGVTLKQSLAPVLDRATIAAVRQWRYTPARKGATSIPYTLPITVEYHLP